MTAHYYPAIFDAPDLDAAKRIILTDEGPGADTVTRWAHETPYVLELARDACGIGPDSVVLDYGCGVGRMARALIEATGCFVIGVDISASMRALAPRYVASPRFVALSPEQFDALADAGLRVDAALAIWVLQHCLTPAEDIARLRAGLRDGGRVFVLNMSHRAVPAAVAQDGAPPAFAWVSDAVDVPALLRAAFAVLAEGAPDPARTPNMGDAGTLWLALRHDGAGGAT